MANIISVKVIFARSSGILTILERADNKSDHLNFSTCCSNLFFCGLGEAVGYNSQLLGELTIAENANTVAYVLKDTSLNQCNSINSSTIFETILKQNKELDKKYQNFIKAAMELEMPEEEYPNMYKEILQFITEQNGGISEFFKNFGYGEHSKPARKLQEYLTKTTEKYLSEMTKAME